MSDTVTAWVLDVEHRARRVTCEVPTGVRPLAAVEAAIERELGIQVGLPVGMRAGTEAEFLFLLPGGARNPSYTPLRELAATDPRGYALYIDAMLGGWAPPASALDVFFFGDSPALAAALAHLVVKGVKRGTACWIEAAQRENVTLPTPGLVSIVTDGFGYALCAIQSQRVEHLRFADIEPHHAFTEGEGDRTLDDWRAGHLDYFTREAVRLGMTFSDDSMIAFETFRVLAVFGQTDR